MDGGWLLLSAVWLGWLLLRRRSASLARLARSELLASALGDLLLALLQAAAQARGGWEGRVAGVLGAYLVYVGLYFRLDCHVNAAITAGACASGRISVRGALVLVVSRSRATRPGGKTKGGGEDWGSGAGWRERREGTRGRGAENSRRRSLPDARSSGLPAGGCSPLYRGDAAALWLHPARHFTPASTWWLGDGWRRVRDDLLLGVDQPGVSESPLFPLRILTIPAPWLQLRGLRADRQTLPHHLGPAGRVGTVHEREHGPARSDPRCSV